MSATRVAVRVDSGEVIGGGHLSRCLALAETVRRLGAEVTFICREHRNDVSGRVEKLGFGLHRLEAPASGAEHDRYDSWLGPSIAADAEATASAAERIRADWLVVDHYGVDREWERIVRTHCGRLLVIDDLRGREHDCDILVDQNLQASDAALPGVIPGAKLELIGPRYALLAESYKLARRLVSRSPVGAARVLVFFGSSEPAGLTATVLRALSREALVDLHVDAVFMGDAQEMDEVRRVAQQRGRCTVHSALPSLAGLMLRADIAVGAGGVSMLERASLGLPSLVVTIAANQREPAEAMANRGGISLLGAADRLGEREWAAALLAFRSDALRMFEMGQVAAGLVDCWGSDRVAAAMFGVGRGRVALRPADADDEALLLDWANDSGVRRNSFDGALISSAGHRAWFTRRLADPGTLMFIATTPDGLPVGQIRLEVDATGSALTDISVDPALRGQGVGKCILEATVARIRHQSGVTRLVAEVRNGNNASRKMFLSSGFREIAAIRGDSATFELRLGDGL